MFSGQQDDWTAQESGTVNGTFDNAIVAHAGQWVQLNLTAVGATQSLLVPFRDQAVVHVPACTGLLFGTPCSRRRASRECMSSFVERGAVIGTLPGHRIGAFYFHLTVKVNKTRLILR